MLASRPKLNFIRWFDEIGIGDVPLVGGKNASLGEMHRELGPQGIKLAFGFARVHHHLLDNPVTEKISNTPSLKQKENVF